jgi:hypothetical protein
VTVPSELQEPTIAVVEPAPRRRVRWYHVAVLGVAVLACAAAVGFFVSQTTDLDVEIHERKRADASLQAQQIATGQARDRLTHTREEATTSLAALEQLTTSFHELTDLSAQEIASVNASHQLAVNNPDAVDEYNAEVDHGNALLTQIEAKAADVQRQADELRSRVDAQLAAAVSSR